MQGRKQPGSPKTPSQGTPAEVRARGTAEQQQKHKGHQIPFGSWSMFFLPCRAHFLCKMLWQVLFWRQHLPQPPAGGMSMVPTGASRLCTSTLTWQTCWKTIWMCPCSSTLLDWPLAGSVCSLPCAQAMSECPLCLTSSCRFWLGNTPDSLMKVSATTINPFLHFCYSQTANSDRIFKYIQLKGNSDIIFPSI